MGASLQRMRSLRGISVISATELAAEAAAATAAGGPNASYVVSGVGGSGDSSAPPGPQSSNLGRDSGPGTRSSVTPPPGGGGGRDSPPPTYLFDTMPYRKISAAQLKMARFSLRFSDAMIEENFLSTRMPWFKLFVLTMGSLFFAFGLTTIILYTTRRDTVFPSYMLYFRIARLAAIFVFGISLVLIRPLFRSPWVVYFGVLGVWVASACATLAGTASRREPAIQEEFLMVVELIFLFNIRMFSFRHVVLMGLGEVLAYVILYFKMEAHSYISAQGVIFMGFIGLILSFNCYFQERRDRDAYVLTLKTEQLVGLVSRMDLEAFSELCTPQERQSNLERSLQIIVERLIEFRAYLPQAVLQQRYAMNKSSSAGGLGGLGLSGIGGTTTTSTTTSGGTLTSSEASFFPTVRIRRGRDDAYVQSNSPTSSPTAKILQPQDWNTTPIGSGLLQGLMREGFSTRDITVLVLKVPFELVDAAVPQRSPKSAATTASGGANGGGSGTARDTLLKMQHQVHTLFLSKFVACLTDTGGLAQSISGGLFVATWNAHRPVVQHARWACYAAVQMITKIMEAISKDIPGLMMIPGLADSLCRIGVASGWCIVGSSGTEKVRTPVVVGDAMDLAMRLVQLNSVLHTAILISQETYEATEPTIVANVVDCVDSVSNYGSSIATAPRHITVYELDGNKASSKPSVDLVRHQQLYKEAFHDFLRHQYIEAEFKLTTYLSQVQLLLTMANLSSTNGGGRDGGPGGATALPIPPGISHGSIPSSAHGATHITPSWPSSTGGTTSGLDINVPTPTNAWHSPLTAPQSQLRFNVAQALRLIRLCVYFQGLPPASRPSNPYRRVFGWSPWEQLSACVDLPDQVLKLAESLIGPSGGAIPPTASTALEGDLLAKAHLRKQDTLKIREQIARSWSGMLERNENTRIRSSPPNMLPPASAVAIQQTIAQQQQTQPPPHHYDYQSYLMRTHSSTSYASTPKINKQGGPVGTVGSPGTGGGGLGVAYEVPAIELPAGAGAPPGTIPAPPSSSTGSKSTRSMSHSSGSKGSSSDRSGGSVTVLKGAGKLSGNLVIGPAWSAAFTSFPPSGGGGNIVQSINDRRTSDVSSKSANTVETAETVVSNLQHFEDYDGEQWSLSDVVLGKGANGKVLLGMNYSGMLVAIKHLAVSASPSQQEEMIKELRLLSTFRHDNIVAYLGSAVVPQGLLIIMEYVSCGSLAFILEHFGKLPAPSVAQYARHILRGLDYLHTHGVVHRDVKPANLLLNHQGQCKLTDFGTAEYLGSSSHSNVKGTPMYMAPEAFRGNACKASDIWSFGLTVLELLTAALPWNVARNTNPNYLMNLVVSTNTQPMIPEHIVEEAREFVQICIHRDHEARPTASSLLQQPFLL